MKRQKLQYLFIMGLLFFSFLIPDANLSAQDNHPAPFVWINDHGQGRQVYVYFRLDFELNELPENANMNLFADSRYCLVVNEAYVNFGPVRFFPKNPVYDTYDLTPYLKKGKNAIVVKVLSNGMNTYQVPKSIGGFTSWGEIKTSKKTIHLETPGNWRCKQENAYDPSSPKMSFATGAIEVFDANKGINNWRSVELDTKNWQKPVKIKNQAHWGEFTKREIPHLTQKPYLPKSLLGAYTLDQSQDFYSFRVKRPDETKSVFNKQEWLYGYTYIYSPRKQDVTTGLWWGEYWLNGKDVKPDFNQTDGRNNYSETTLHLKEGWNFFFVAYGVFQSLWDFYMAVPADAGLILSPDKKKDATNIFMTSKAFAKEITGFPQQKTIPATNHKQLPRRLKKWNPVPRGAYANNPAWDMAWRTVEKKLAISEHQVQHIEIPEGEEAALVFDMGGKKLARIFIEYEAPKGTKVDIGFSEDLRDGRASILKRPGIYTATRHISSGGKMYHETFKPYGLRYLQVNITDNKNAKVKIKRVGVVNQIYPFTKKGSFQCSDPMFNAIWELGWRTLEVCSEDTYTDTPFRERGLYAGDALPEFAITLATSGDARLVKRSLEVFQDKYRDLFYEDKKAPSGEPGLLSDFPFLTLEYFRWYVDWTGDLDFAEELYDNYKLLVDNALKTKDERGLFKNNRAFIEWTKIDKQAQLTAMQGIMIRSLENLAHLAKKLGYKADAKIYNTEKEQAVKAVRKHAWNEQKGAYRDGFKNGNPIDNYYPVSSAWMSLGGYNAAEREEKLDKFYREELADIGNESRNRKITPYGGFYMLGALYRQGNADIAENFIRKYWSPMILKYDDTAWENFDDGTGSSGGQGTLSHAWAGGPTYYMSTEVLGVKLGFPYFFDPNKLEISPQAENINWAKGSVPHPKGVIYVDWKIKGQKLFLNCSVPDGIVWEVKPKGKLAQLELWVNGKRK